MPFFSMLRDPRSQPRRISAPPNPPPRSESLRSETLGPAPAPPEPPAPAASSSGSAVDDPSGVPQRRRSSAREAEGMSRKLRTVSLDDPGSDYVEPAVDDAAATDAVAPPPAEAELTMPTA
eukprot:1657999-Prymnesium_polylepis.1